MSVTQFDDDMVPRDIALVFAANNSFASGFLVTLASALACSDLGRFKIYFLHDEEEDVSRLVAQAKRICRQFNYPVDYFDVLPVNLTEFKVCESTPLSPHESLSGHLTQKANS